MALAAVDAEGDVAAGQAADSPRCRIAAAAEGVPPLPELEGRAACLQRHAAGRSQAGPGAGGAQAWCGESC